MDKEERGLEVSNRVVCGSRQVAMYEMWKRMQIHEDKIIVKSFGNMREDMVSYEEWTGRERSWYGAECVRDARGEEWDQS